MLKRSFLPLRLNLVDKVVVIALVDENMVIIIVGIKGRANKVVTAATPVERMTDTTTEVPYKAFTSLLFFFILLIFISDSCNFYSKTALLYQSTQPQVAFNICSKWKNLSCI